MRQGLLPYVGVMSTVIPAAYVRGHSGAPQFPSYLGKYSNGAKQLRLLKVKKWMLFVACGFIVVCSQPVRPQDVQIHMAHATSSCDKREIRLDYVPHLVQPLLQPLVEKGKVREYLVCFCALKKKTQDGVEELMTFMDSYGLTKDDWESVFVLSSKEKLIEDIPSLVKVCCCWFRFSLVLSRISSWAHSGGIYPYL